MKDKVNQGFFGELKKKQTQQEKKPFNYSKPVSKPEPIQNMALNARNREHKSVPVDKTTNFAAEQSNAKKSHKG